MQKIIKDDNDDTIIRKKAVDLGFRTLQQQLKDMLIAGETSLDEAIRVGLKE
jgi:general secretion pathway protein E